MKRIVVTVFLCVLVVLVLTAFSPLRPALQSSDPLRPEELSGWAGVLLSLLVAYVPGVNGWYQAQDPKGKAAIMAGLLLLVTLSIFGLSCAGLAVDFGLSVTCTKVSAIGLVRVFIAALVANQSAYLLLRPYRAKQTI
jgi:hypothetical protein